MNCKIISSVLTLLFFSAIIGCTGRDYSKVIIKGSIPKEITKIIIMERKGMIRTLQHCKIDTPGTFAVELPVKAATHIMLSSVGAEKSYDQDLFISGGDVIEFSCNSDGIVYDGDRKNENSCLQELKKRQLLNQRTRPDMMDELNYQTRIFRERDSLLHFLEQQKEVATDFMEIQREWIQYDAWNALLDLPKNRKLFLRDETPLDDNYWYFLNEVQFDAPVAHLVTFAVDVAEKAFVAQERYRGAFQGTGLNDYLNSRAVRIGNSKLREEFVLHSLQIELFAFNQHLDYIINQVAEYVSSREGQQALEVIKQSYTKQKLEFATLTKGNKAPLVAGVNRDGKSFKLADYAGKVIVIDVWGTKCVPCIEEIPYVKQLETYFEGKPVEFVSVAMEDDRERWISFLDKREMKGNQFMDSTLFNGDFCKAYRIRSIPRFIIIDQQGLLVEAFAPRPSDLRLKRMIESLITP